MATTSTPKFTYDRAFQRRMLRTLFQDPDFTCSTGSHLSHEHFETPPVRWIAQKILNYARKHGTGISDDAIRIELQRDLNLGRLNKDTGAKVAPLVDALDRPVKDKSFIREELFRFIKNQATRTALLNSLDHLDAEDFDAIDTEFKTVLEIQETLTGGLGQFYVGGVGDRTKRRKAYTKDGISTGLKFDEYLKPGGLPPKALGTVVAPSGKGKSHMLVHLGAAAVLESNIPVLHITTELSEDMIMDRYDARFSGIPVGKLESDRLSVRKAVRGLGAKYGEFLVVKEFPPAAITAQDIRAFVRQLERVAFYPGMIVVDSADDMLPSRMSRDNNLYLDMGLVWRELRRLAVELKVPVWTASQTNKNVLNKEFFDWNDIADSSRKVMVSDLVLILLQTIAEKKMKRARIFNGKSRFGPDKFELKVRLDWARSHMKDA